MNSGDWCFQCGIEGRPTKAVGNDADGEPACVGHSVKAKRPLILTQAPASEPAAAPSAVQTKVEEEMGTQSRGLRPRSNCKVCGREIADFVLAKHMRAKHGGDPTVAIPKSTSASITVANKVSAPLSNAAEKTVSPVVLGETYEPGITLTLPASKVQRLFELLLR